MRKCKFLSMCTVPKITGPAPKENDFFNYVFVVILLWYCVLSTIILLNESTLQSPIAKIDHLLHNPSIAWCMLITTCRTHSGGVHASVKILNGISFKQIIWVWIMTYLFLQIIMVNVYQLHYCKLCKVSMELFKDIIEKYGTNIKYFSNYYHNESI